MNGAVSAGRRGAGLPAFVKVCCVQDRTELEIVERLWPGPSGLHVGLVGEMPSGPGPISDERIALIARAARRATPVLLTSRTSADEIVAHADLGGVSAVQIVNTVPEEVRRAIREAHPTLTIVQVVHVEGPESVGVARAAAEGADYVLLDSGRPSAPVPELGGTGRVHDWSVSAEIVRALKVPVVLAGGLTPENVREAIEAVRPQGIDFCSGVRDAEARLLPDRLQAMFAAAGAA